MGQSIQDSLEFGNGKFGSTVEDRVAIVKLGKQGTSKINCLQFVSRTLSGS